MENSQIKKVSAGDDFFKWIMFFSLGVLALVLIALFVAMKHTNSSEFKESEITTEQYKSIQTEVMLGGQKLGEVVAQALRDDKITQAEYKAIQAANEATTKAEMIEQIKADANASSVND